MRICCIVVKVYLYVIIPNLSFVSACKRWSDIRKLLCPAYMYSIQKSVNDWKISGTGTILLAVPIVKQCYSILYVD